MEMRCFSPPERLEPPSPTMVSYPWGSAMMKSWQRAALLRRLHPPRSIRTAKTDVIADGVVEQIHILKYHGNVAQEAVAGHLPDVIAAHGDASLIHIIKPGQQCAEGALPAAGRPTMAVALFCGSWKETSWITSRVP
mgnify:CR=1 FL=1